MVSVENGTIGTQKQKMQRNQIGDIVFTTGNIPIRSNKKTNQISFGLWLMPCCACTVDRQGAWGRESGSEYDEEINHSANSFIHLFWFVL